MDLSANSMDNIRMANQPTSKPPREDRLRLSYLYGGSVRYQPGESLGPRLLTDFEVVLLIEGHATYQNGDDRNELSPGDLILARPGFRETYTWDTQNCTRHAFFHFGLLAIPHEWPEPEHWPVVRHRPDAAAEGLFHSVLRRSHKRSENPSVTPPHIDSHLVEMLLELLMDDSQEARSF